MTSSPWRRGGGAFTGWWWAWAKLSPHETAIAGLRELIFKSTPVKPWEETAERFATCLQEAVGHANAEHHLADLCREMPQRLDALVKVYEGDRLPK